MLSFVFFLCVFCFVLFSGEFTHLPFTMFFNSKYSQQVPLINSNLYVFQLICMAKSTSSRIFALSKKLRNEREILCAVGKTVFCCCCCTLLMAYKVLYRLDFILFVVLIEIIKLTTNVLFRYIESTITLILVKAERVYSSVSFAYKSTFILSGYRSSLKGDFLSVCNLL